MTTLMIELMGGVGGAFFLLSDLMYPEQLSVRQLSQDNPLLSVIYERLDMKQESWLKATML